MALHHMVAELFIQQNLECSNVRYSIYTKVCGHPYEISGFGCFSLTIADRCIKYKHTAMQSP
jgi:uncharacterized membrane protein